MSLVRRRSYVGGMTTPWQMRQDLILIDEAEIARRLERSSRTGHHVN